MDTLYAVTPIGGLMEWTQAMWPSSLPPLVRALDAGTYHWVAVLPNNSAIAIGTDHGGWTHVPIAELTAGVAAVAAGGVHSLALLMTGAVVGWGRLPQAAVPPAARSGVVAISAGSRHSLALLATGAVVCWGDARACAVPPEVAAIGAVRVSAGTTHSAALLRTGEVVVWGSPVAMAGQPASIRGLARGVAAGQDFTLVLLADGTVTGWGSNGQGALNIPLEVRTPGAVVALAAGMGHGLAVMSDQRVVAWGLAANGQTRVPLEASQGNLVVAGDFCSFILRAVASPTPDPALEPTPGPTPEPTPVPAPGECRVIPGQVLGEVGGEYAVLAAEAPEECCAACTEDPDCAVWVLQQGQCLLKDSTALSQAPTAANDAVSGVRPAASPGDAPPSDFPVEPVAPDAPPTPGEPFAPGIPGAPPRPGAPVARLMPPPFPVLRPVPAPLAPGFPNAPPAPQVPAAPQVPSAPPAPATPVDPGAPGEPPVPPAPQAPTEPSTPGTPVSPVLSPDSPGLPSAPPPVGGSFIPENQTTPDAPAPLAPTSPTFQSSPNAPAVPVLPPPPGSAVPPQVQAGTGVSKQGSTSRTLPVPMMVGVIVGTVAAILAALAVFVFMRRRAQWHLRAAVRPATSASPSPLPSPSPSAPSRGAMVDKPPVCPPDSPVSEDPAFSDPPSSSSGSQHGSPTLEAPTPAPCPSVSCREPHPAPRPSALADTSASPNSSTRWRQLGRLWYPAPSSPTANTAAAAAGVMLASNAVYGLHEEEDAEEDGEHNDDTDQHRTHGDAHVIIRPWPATRSVAQGVPLGVGLSQPGIDDLSPHDSGHGSDGGSLSLPPPPHMY